MKIVFFGSSEFAVPSLEAIFNRGDQIACVVTQPDKKKGRGLKKAQTAICLTAKALGIEVHQPEEVGEGSSIELLKQTRADLFVVIAYGQILPEAILEIPRIFPINLHASLLPKYRGAAPINWVLINGEKTTGLSVIKMVKKMDAGELILQKKTNILNSDDALTLEQRLSSEAAGVLLEALEKIETGQYRLSAQDEKKVTFAPRLDRDDGLINWEKSAKEVLDLIRGCMGWPQAFTYFNRKILKIFDADISDQPHPQSFSAGQINDVSKQDISVVTSKGCIRIRELQLEGKRRMKAEEFLLGHKLCPGDRVGRKNNI